MPAIDLHVLRPGQRRRWIAAISLLALLGLLATLAPPAAAEPGSTTGTAGPTVSGNSTATTDSADPTAPTEEPDPSDPTDPSDPSGPSDPTGPSDPSASAAVPVTPRNSNSTRVLVFGEADNGFEGDNTAATLGALGYQVDRVARVPDDLSDYEVIWHVECYRSLAEGEPERLAEFVRNGGGLYLTGERPCCEPLNTSVEQTLHLAGVDPAVSVGGLGDIDGPFTFNSAALGDVSRFPNLLLEFVPDSPGGLTGLGGLDGPNVLASTDEVAVGAVWDQPGIGSAGRIVLLMDIDYLGDLSRTRIVQNIQNFLEGGDGCDDTRHWDGFAWLGPEPQLSPSNCSTLIAPDQIVWAAASDAGPVDIEVVGSGITPTCDTEVVAGVTRVTCELPPIDWTDDPARLRVTASDAEGSSVRSYTVRPMNDPRNVPVPFALDSNWWDWPDADGDGIPDHWEINGVWVNGTFLDLPGQGLDPNRKDLLLRFDVEAGAELHEDVYDNLREAFADAPLTNPDGSTGVTLHVDVGDPIPSSVVGEFELDADNLVRVITYSGFGTAPEFGGGGVPQLANYLINLADYRPGGESTNIIGMAYVKGSFGFTAFGESGSERFRASLELLRLPGNAVRFVQANNAMHELGHQFGLLHHGAQSEPEDDPTYRSVMSYAYNVFGVPTNRLGLSTRIDYAREDTINLDWQMGPELGQLTFVVGQHGELPGFYIASNQPQLLTHDPAIEQHDDEDHNLDQFLLGASPEAMEQFEESFEVEFANRPPTAESVDVEVAAGSSVEVELTGTDPDGEPVSFRLLTAPAHGQARIDGEVLTYTADADYEGPDELTFRASDGVLSSLPATVTITVFPGGPTPPTCADAEPVAPFRDVLPGTTHAEAISCAAGLSLVRGVGEGRFAPAGTLTRAQTATILYGALEASGIALTEEQRFLDVSASNVHATAIRRLAAAGIIEGRSPGTFDPGAPVSRAQLASLLDRTSTSLLAPYPDGGPAGFTDTAGSVHAEAIDRLADAGIILGRSPTSFGPGAAVTRAQAASLFVRWLEDQAERLS